ncbi:hypothetical protein ACIBQ6_22180 [Nonomuraea sp. NPDC049655]|uniref:hypothetical protein n=1 Tax=Nonomuraea sp. NPDC049655 TaxID=3364355 RepID=UPI0037A0441D
MPETTPDDDLSYAERMRRKGVQTRTAGWSHATRDEVAEGRTEEGGRFKAVRDTAGHIVTEETTPSGRQRKHVTINLG